MRRIPEFRLVVQTYESGERRIEPKDARDLLVHRPQEFVHINVGVGGIRRYGERSRSDRALFVDRLLEAAQVGRVSHADWATLISRYQALQLDCYHARHAQTLILSDESADRFGRRC